MVGDKSVGDRYIPRLAICQIIEARVEEMFSIVKKRLEHLGASLTPGGRGGGRDSHGRHFAFAVDRARGRARLRLARPPPSRTAWLTESLRGPEYSTAVGLLLFALNAPQRENPKSTAHGGDGLLSQIARWFGTR